MEILQSDFVLFVCLFVWWCLTPLSTIFQLCRGGHFFLVEKTGGPGENHRPVANKLYHVMLYTSPWSRCELTTPVVIGTDCILCIVSVINYCLFSVYIQELFTAFYSQRHQNVNVNWTMQSTLFRAKWTVN